MRDLLLALAVSATLLAAVWNDPDFATAGAARHVRPATLSWR